MHESRGVRVRENTGRGRFDRASTSLHLPAGVSDRATVAGDVNEDGTVDLVVGSTDNVMLRVFLNVGGEGCDDGNDDAGDGCDAVCAVE